MGIVIQSLIKYFRNGGEVTEVLRDVSMEIPDGQFAAIIGPSGSGKSTLMNIIGCLDRFNQGAYFLNGHDVGKMHDDRLAEIRNGYIGFIFQFFNLLPQYTAVENVELPLFYANVQPNQARKRAVEALGILGLENRLHYKPSQLSGGQKQRVAIARAIVNQPTVILADEPTGSLDSKTGREVMAILKDLHQQGKTIVMVTHDIGLAGEAERRIHIRDGKIVEEVGP